MSEETTPTRQETVEANITAVETMYGNIGYPQIISQCIKDISVSLAMLVDNDSGSASGSDNEPIS